MSRIFDALRQSELDRGAGSPQVLDVLDATPGFHDEPQTFNLNTISAISSNPALEARLISLSNDASLGAEKFRLLATRMQVLQDQRQLKTLLVSSAGMGDGKTFASANLAVTLARRFKKNVLLVDGDLRQRKLPMLFGLANGPGLQDWYSNQAELTKIVYRLNDLSCFLLPAGASGSDPVELLQSSRTAELLRRLSGAFDWVLIDSPPVLPLADTTVWMRNCDGVLLIVREGWTQKTILMKALEAVDPSKLVGVVLNNAVEAKWDNYQSYSPQAGK